MTKVVADKTAHSITIERPRAGRPIIQVETPCAVSIRGGTVITIDGEKIAFGQDVHIASKPLIPGKDYAVGINGEGELYIKIADENPLNGKSFGLPLRTKLHRDRQQWR